MAKRGQPYKPYMVGPPYQIDGKWYYPKEDFDYDRTGVASWYGRTFHGRRTANGETYDMNLMTAAHPTLPMPTIVDVTNLSNGRSIVVRINDRGPFHDGRIIDLSRRAAERLGLKRAGVGRVRVRVLRTASRQLKRQALSEMTVAEKSERRKQVATQYRAATTGDPAALARMNPGAGPARIGPPIDIRPGAPAAPPDNDERADGQYYVQVGSFTERSNAIRTGQRLEGVALTRIAKREIDSAAFYRVRVGPFATRAESRKMLRRIRNAGYSDARIVME